MAQAVKRLWPDTKLAIGPAIDEGFYYDFDSSESFNDEDMVKIEEEMKKIIKEDLPIERFTLPKDEALKLMADEPYKVELINDLAHIRKGEKYNFPKDIIEVEYKEFEASSIDGEGKPANYYIMLSKSYNDNVTLKHK